MKPNALFPKDYADRAARLRVPCGFALAGAFLWFSRPSSASLAIGLPIALVGVLLRAWAAGHLRKDATLTTSGPYAWIRNPLYLGTLTAAVGLAVASHRWGLGVLFALFFVLVYWPAIELEQQHLRDLFGPQFDRYSQRVRMLIPRLRPIPSSDGFSWSLYIKNREYEALAGLAAGAVFLTAKWLWSGGP